MNLSKPMLKMTGKGMTILILIVGLFMIAFGAYIGLFQSHGYVKTTAVVTEVTEDTDGDPEEVTYIPTVSYTVDGKEYIAVLNTSVKENSVGEEIKVRYDPSDPTRVNADSPGLVIYLIAVGAALTGFSVYGMLRSKKRVEELSEVQPAALFGASRTGDTERKLYFTTDLGTAKGTCHIEDAERKVLYAAESVKFSLVADSEYAFVDHVLGRRTQHLVGKPVTSSSDSLWVLDNHSTFDFDGRDIWKVLHENGVRIQTALNGIRWTYTIYRDGRQIAYAETCGKYVHEEDEAKKGLIAKTPFKGFYRITTAEENLDVIFLVLFAVGRTDMMTYS